MAFGLCAACTLGMTASVSAESVNYYGFDDPVPLNIGVAYNSDFSWAPGESVEDNAWWNLYKENGFDLQLMYSVDGTQADTKRTTAMLPVLIRILCM